MEIRKILTGLALVTAIASVGCSKQDSKPAETQSRSSLPFSLYGKYTEESRTSGNTRIDTIKYSEPSKDGKTETYITSIKVSSNQPASR